MHKKPVTILFADDDAEDYDHLREALQGIDAGVQLIQAWNGAEVIEHLAKGDAGNLPSLLILDFNMPLINGLEVLVKIGRDQRYAAIPKVMYSTSNSSFHIDLCIQAGAKKYFVKPNDRKELPVIAQEMMNIATLY
jgi:CheY-like chemotaxis protein